MRKFLVIAIMSFLSACSLVTPRDVGKANMFTLAAPADIASHKHSKAVLKIRYPSAPSELDTYRIAVALMDGRQDYFASARWNEFLPSLVQSSLQDSLSHSQLFSYVDTDESASAAGYVLATEIQECRAFYSHKNGAPTATIRIVFRLTAAGSGKVVAKFTTEESALAEGNSLPAIARAFNAAFASVVQETVEKLEAKL